jgi:hypothetical protein
VQAETTRQLEQDFKRKHLGVLGVLVWILWVFFLSFGLVRMEMLI